MIRAAMYALRFEALTLLRTREAYTFGLLPAVLFLPVCAGVAAIIVSFTLADPTVAVPMEEIPGVELIGALERDWEVVPVQDPGAAVAERKADVAVLAWSLDEPGEYWLQVQLDGDASLRSKLRVSLERAVDAQVDERIEAAGGRPVADRKVARVTSPSPDVDTTWIWRLVPLYGVGIAAYVGLFLVPVRTASERLSGTLESFAVTATSAGLVYLARAFVGTAYGLALVALPALSMWLIVGGFLPVEEILIGPLDLVEAAAHVLVFNILFIACGLLAGSNRVALYAGSMVIMFALPLYGVHHLVPVPWVPILGIGVKAPLAAWGVRMAGTFLLGAGALFALIRIARGERVLPRGEADE